jgi:hypothetical protein
MKKKHKKFIKILKKYLKMSPELRITQALFNLNVTEALVKGDEYYFKDNYNQSDEKTINKVKEAFEKQYKSFFKGIIKEKGVEGETYYQEEHSNKP